MIVDFNEHQLRQALVVFKAYCKHCDTTDVFGEGHRMVAEAEERLLNIIGLTRSGKKKESK